VWRSLTEPEHLKSWFPDQVTGELRVGARLRFVDPGNVAQGFEGEVLACDPPSLLEFMWGTDTLRFEIEPDGPDEYRYLEYSGVSETTETTEIQRLMM
jgi:uncharacterized protein YndB with AHSA1/START domain